MFAMTPENAPRLAIGALVLMLATFIITLWLGYGFSVAVMMLIAAAGFLTILAVMAIGSTHGETPVAASDSEAVTRWNERVSNRLQTLPDDDPDEPETTGTALEDETNTST